MYLPIAYGDTIYFAQPDALKVRIYEILNKYSIPYRTKVWQEKSLANLLNFTKLPNFFHQSYLAIQLLLSVLQCFLQTLFHQIDFYIFAKLFSHQTFILYGIFFMRDPLVKL